MKITFSKLTSCLILAAMVFTYSNVSSAEANVIAKNEVNLTIRNNASLQITVYPFGPEQKFEIQSQRAGILHFSSNGSQAAEVYIHDERKGDLPGCWVAADFDKKPVEVSVKPIFTDKYLKCELKDKDIIVSDPSKQ